jgi:hypothetical protein
MDRAILFGRRAISGRQSSDGAPAGEVVTMSRVQIGINQCLHFAAGRCLLDCRDGAVAPLLQSRLKCLDDEALLAAEVPIEDAVRQAEIAHQLSDGRPFGSAAAKSAGRGADDALACLLLVIRRVTHTD